MPPNPSRRRILEATAAGLVTGLAGCSEVTKRVERRKEPNSDEESNKSSGFPTGQTGKLVSEDRESSDELGASVAVSSDGATAIITAPREAGDDGDVPDTGAAYIFSRDNESWSQDAKLTPNNREPKTLFGYSADISADGSTVVVCSRSVELSGDSSSGAAYVFSLKDGSWTREAKLTRENPRDNDHFGESVGISDDGSTIVVCGIKQEENETGGYVFSRGDNSWTLDVKLLPDDDDLGPTSSWFGDSVDVSRDGSTVVIGASGVSTKVNSDLGAAFVFSQENDSWKQEAFIHAAGAVTKGRFGSSVEISGDGSTIVAEGYVQLDEDGNPSEIGPVRYVFSRTDGSWSQEDRLNENDYVYGRFEFTTSLSEDGSLMAISGNGKTFNEKYKPVGYILSRSDDSWEKESDLAVDEAADRENIYGSSISLSADGGMAIVGTPGISTSDRDHLGAAYVFE